MNIGKRLQALRIARGYKSGSALAEAANVAQSQVSAIELDKSDMRLSTLQSLASALRMSPAELLAQLMGEDRPTEDLAWFWRTRFATLSAPEIAELKRNESQRIAWAIRQMLDWMPGHTVASILDMQIGDLRDIADGRVPAGSGLQDELEKAGVPITWLINGEPVPIDEDLRQLLRLPLAGAYIKAILRAAAEGLRPELLENQIDVLLSARKQ